MKSDRLQGILFDTTQPVLLQQKAAARAKAAKTKAKLPAFFHKIQTYKPDIKRITRRNKTSPSDNAAKYVPYLSDDEIESVKDSF